MPFTIPNLANASRADQAFPNSADFDILRDAAAPNGVVSGCAVTAQATPDMTVAVAAGTVRFGDSTVSVSAGNVTIPAANADPRRDLVVVDTSGVKSVVTGTPVAVDPNDPTVVPVLPALPANRVALAAVDVPGNATAITNAYIVDKRVFVPTASAVGTETTVVKTADETVNNSTVLQDDDHLSFSVQANGVYFVEVYLLLVQADALGDFTFGWSVPSGTTMTWGQSTQWHTSGDHGGLTEAQTTNITSAGTTPFVAWLAGWVFVGGTAGSVTLRWAQNTARAANNTVKARSFLVYRKLA